MDGIVAGGHRRVELDVDAYSPSGAGRLYEQLGFVAVGRSVVLGKPI